MIRIREFYFEGRIFVVTWAGVGLFSYWRRWVRRGCFIGWYLVVLVFGFCCFEVRFV